MVSDVFNVGTNNPSYRTEKEQYIMLPIECEPTQHQMYSLNIRQDFEFKNGSTIRVRFTDMDDTLLEFTTPAYINLDFVEGKHL